MKGCIVVFGLFCCLAVCSPLKASAQCYDLETGELLAGSAVTEEASYSAFAAAVQCGCKQPSAPEGCTVASTASNCSPHSSGEGCNGTCQFQQTCTDPDDNATITKDCKPLKRPKPKDDQQVADGAQQISLH